MAALNGYPFRLPHVRFWTVEVWSVAKEGHDMEHAVWSYFTLVELKQSSEQEEDSLLGELTASCLLTGQGLADVRPHI